MIDLQQMYLRPNIEAARQEANGYERELKSAGDAEAFFEILTRWNALRSELDAQETLAEVLYRADTQKQTEREFFQTASPEIMEMNQRRTLAILESPFQREYAARFGEHTLAKQRCEATSFHPKIKAILAQESAIVGQYMTLLSRPEIEMSGKKIGLSGLERFFTSSSREERFTAQKARESFLQRHQDELDEIYTRLVALRTQMGSALGFDSYLPLGYQLRKRVSHGPDELASFRAEILSSIVPIAREVASSRAKRLGVSPLLFHDEPVYDLNGNPKPLGDASFCLRAIEEMFRDMGPEFVAFFQLMKERELFDLEDRPNKAYGAFATVFVTHKLPFVSASVNGSAHDVYAMVHEFGHAFHGYNQRNASMLETQFTTSDAAEVHSIGLENLAHPYYELFFGADAARYRKVHMEQQILFMPYAALVDGFEHELYERPHLTPKERRQLWRNLERQYQPYRNYGGLFPHVESGVYWHRQGHLFFAPLSYLDYVLAGACALQLWQRARKNRPEAIEDYLRICRPQGSKDFPTMLKNGRFVSPFAQGCLRDVALAAQEFLQGAETPSI